MYTDEQLNDWRAACTISADALQLGKSLIKNNVPMVEVVDKVDKFMIDQGSFPSFPAQISLDNTAAHYCCSLNDPIILQNNVCKLDVGAHINGFPGDNALTVDLSGGNADLVKAAHQALDNAIKIMKPGTTLGEIGETIQSEITSFGFSPIRNLSGHGLAQFDLHTKPTVPNFNNNDPTALVSGQIIACEPFATTGEGIIYESTNPEVFGYLGKKPVRDMTARKIQEQLEQYQGLPFAKRWLMKEFPAFKVQMAFRELEKVGSIQGFPPLMEQAQGLVSQAEHTILITDSGCEILTKPSE